MSEIEETLEKEEMRNLRRLINDETSEVQYVRASLSKIVKNGFTCYWKNGNPLVWAVKKNRTELIEHLVEAIGIDSISIKDQVF